MWGPTGGPIGDTLQAQNSMGDPMRSPQSSRRAPTGLPAGFLQVLLCSPQFSARASNMRRLWDPFTDIVGPLPRLHTIQTVAVSPTLGCACGADGVDNIPVSATDLLQAPSGGTLQGSPLSQLLMSRRYRFGMGEHRGVLVQLLNSAHWTARHTGRACPPNAFCMRATGEAKGFPEPSQEF